MEGHPYVHIDIQKVHWYSQKNPGIACLPQ
jgi:hypothetical protein